MGDVVEYIRLYVNPFIGSTFTDGKKFNIRKSTRNFINKTLIKNFEGKEDTETASKLNRLNIPNNAFGHIHHLATYLDNIHLTIFPGKRDRDHLTIAFKDKSRIIVDYNHDIPKLGKNLGFRPAMEGNMPQPDKGGNAFLLASVFPVIEQTIQPVILRIYNDIYVQPYLSPDSSPPELKTESQSSIEMGPTQDDIEFEISSQKDRSSESDDLTEFLKGLEPAINESNISKEDEEEERKLIKKTKGEKEAIGTLGPKRTSSKRRNSKIKDRFNPYGRGKKTKKGKKNEKTKKRKNKKQKKTKKKKN